MKITKQLIKLLSEDPKAWTEEFLPFNTPQEKNLIFKFFNLLSKKSRHVFLDFIINMNLNFHFNLSDNIYTESEKICQQHVFYFGVKIKQDISLQGNAEDDEWFAGKHLFWDKKKNIYFVCPSIYMDITSNPAPYRTFQFLRMAINSLRKKT